MSSITEYVMKLQELTETNLEILQALNDSFFSKQNHLSVNIAGNRYAIPSFISLENKLNSLMANFENLVNAPESGEAFFDFNGNTRAINVRSYTSTPNSIVLNPVSSFMVENNDIFKDFMTPCPYINLNLTDLPNDTVQVIVKKVIPIHSDLVSLFESNLVAGDVNYPSIKYSYKDLYKILTAYEPDKDYIEYDTKLDLPIRKNIGSGAYVIEKVVEDIVDENLDNYITIKFRSDMQDSIYMNALKYRLFDETIERMLKVGDQLVTFEGNAKMEITEVRTNTNTVVVKVLNGEFLNLVESSTNNPDNISSLSKIKFYSPIDFDKDKYVKVPLEEDKYVFITIAGLNSRMNVQSPWGSGLILHTDMLKNGDESFRKYYNENVRNVGDILFEITSMMSNTLTGFTESEFANISGFVPETDRINIQVTQINKHLNDSISVQNIRSLYSQKKEYQSQLSEVQKEIDDINATLASVSFDDVSGVRTAYTDRLTNLSTRKNEIVTSITKTMDEISIAANNSETPIENAKYRIRGFFDIESLDNADHIKGIRVQYRYKNVDQEQGTAFTIDDKFIFSDWNDMASFDRVRVPSYSNGSYKFAIAEYNGNKNEPSFNQIDIPISQGETVDIRLKVVYDYGAPFVTVSSAWSNIINVAFPEDQVKNVQVLDIIAENNNDIETNRFQNILKDGGVPDHIGDKITDQDITYYHKPENIASGFYTAERRIIPLKDKLSALDAALAELRGEVFGASDSLKVTLKHGENIYDLSPYQERKVQVEQYSTFTSEDSNATAKFEGLYEYDNNGAVNTIMYISLHNESDNAIKLYSLFPGNRRDGLKYDAQYKVNTKDYCFASGGVYIDKPTEDNNDTKFQTYNQYLYFRVNNVHTGVEYYGSTDVDDTISSDDPTSIFQNRKSTMYPKLQSQDALCMDSDTIGTYLVIGPGEEILVPIIFKYKLAAESSNRTQKTMSFEILPSLYKNPVPYTFTVSATKTATTQDKLVMTSGKKMRSWWGNNAAKWLPKIK